MPVEHSIDHDERLVFSRAFGAIDDQDLLNQRRRLTAHPRFEPHFDQLFEFTEVVDVQLSAYGVALLADRQPFGPHSRRAFVTTADSRAAQQMLGVYERLDEKYPDELRAYFDGVKAARVWLQSQSPVHEL